MALLRRHAAGEVRDDDATRELYAADAGIYRRLPVGALRAAAADDLDVAVAACREGGVPLTMRGAGTSLAGQAVGRGLVVDTSALAAIEIDPGRRVARVGPGAVLDDLNRAAAAARPGLRPRRRVGEPGDARRHDRQQLRRRPLDRLRPHRRARARRSTSPWPTAPAPPCAAAGRRPRPSRPRAPWRRRRASRPCCGASRATTSGRWPATSRTGRGCSAGRRARSPSSAAPSWPWSSARPPAAWRCCRSPRSTRPSRPRSPRSRAPPRPSS